MRKVKTMQNRNNRKYQQQGGCNRRVVNKGLSKRTQDALRDQAYLREIAQIEKEHSCEGLLND